jgi:hypothetical protein
MGKLINKPHLIFWISIPFIVLSGFISSEEVLDFNIYDTYFVISLLYVNTLIAILFGIIGLGYWIMLKTKRPLSKWMNFFHIILTFGCPILIWILAQFYRESIMEYDFNNNLTFAIYLKAIVAIIGQIIFPVNIIIGLIKKRNETSV